MPKRLGNPADKLNNVHMPPKSKRIHLIERVNRLVRLSVDEPLWESGCWPLAESKAKQLLGGSILFHKKQREPSFFGGIIVNYRIEDKGQLKGRVIFTFQYLADHKNVSVDSKGWSQAMKVVA